MEKGLIHLYYGDGKGKTTAAVGLCIRAAGNKKRVLFTQFMKDGSSGEISLLKELPGTEVLWGNVPYGFYSRMDDEEKRLFAKKQEKLFQKLLEKIEEERKRISACTQNAAEAEKTPVWDGVSMLLVMDEITYAYGFRLIDRVRLENLLNNKPDFLEIVMTGRNPERFLVDAADYVTEMKCEKHPFEKGISARKGVEF